MSRKQTAARIRVKRLMVELRDALAACEQGPLRAMVDSDGHCIVQSNAMTVPWGNERRVWGVPTPMLRDVYGPLPRLRDIIVEVR